MHNEPDGTPCMVRTGLPGRVEFGTCRNNVCTQDVPHKALKRKKRFICLYTFGRIIHLKKQRRRLQKKLSELQEKLSRNGYGDGGNERGRGIDGTTSGLLGIDNGGSNGGAGFGTRYVGTRESGISNSGFTESGSGGSLFAPVRNPGFERRNGAETETGVAGSMPNTGVRTFGKGAIRSSEDIEPGEQRIRYLNNADMGLEGETGFDEE